MDAVEEPRSPPIVPTPGRELAARALLRRPRLFAAAGQRPARRQPTDDRPDGRGRSHDRRCVTRRCSRRRGRVSPRPPAAAARPRNATRRSRGWRRRPATNTRSRGCRRSRRPAARRPEAVRRPTATPALTATAPRPPRPLSPRAAPLLQVDALRRQQQRILHRSALIDYVLTAEKRGGETADDGGRAGRAARRHHRGGAHDRDAPADRERATLTHDGSDQPDTKSDPGQAPSILVDGPTFIQCPVLGLRMSSPGPCEGAERNSS